MKGMGSMGSDGANRHPIDGHVGAQLRARRIVMGLSQNELGHALGVTFQQIQKYEKGTNRIGASRLFELASILKVDVQYFFDGLSPDSTGDIAGSFLQHDGSPSDPDLKNEPTQRSQTGQLAASAGPERVESERAGAERAQLCEHYDRINNPSVKKRLLDLVKSLSADRTNTGRSTHNDI